MTGLALWAGAGPATRSLLIRIACDGDLRHDVKSAHHASVRLTIAQALEVLG